MSNPMPTALRAVSLSRPTVLTLIAACSVLLGAPASALAGTIAMVGGSPLYTDAGVETNMVSAAAGLPGTITITDLAAPVLDGDGGGGCSVSGDTATCPATGTMVFSLGASGDSLTIALGFPLATSITAGSGDDTLALGDEADEVWDGAGGDSVSTGAGTDTIHVDTTDTNSDTYGGGLGTDTIDYSGRSAAVTLTPDATANDGDIAAGEADDLANDFETVLGGGGADQLWDGGSTSSIDGAGGDDTIYATDTPDGGDTYTGGLGVDTVSYFQRTDDVTVDLEGDADDGQPSPPENDTIADDVENLAGGAGADSISGSSDANVLDGGAGLDNIVGDAGNDTIIAGDGDDVITAGDGDDFVLGGAGDDAVRDGDGADDVDGGDDADTFRTTAASANDSGDDFVGGNGLDTITWVDRGAAEAVSVSLDDAANDGGSAGAEADNVHSSIETVIGGSGDDTITGSAGNETLSAGPGDDTVSGLGGNDTLNGDDDSDSVDGGSGDDTIGESDTDFDGVNTLEGGAGDDTITGGAGQDTVPQGAADDGSDTIDDGTSAGDLLVDYSQRTIAISATPNTLNTADDGESGEQDALGGYVDAVNTGTGNDTIDYSNSNVSAAVSGGDGNDTITGYIGSDYLNGDDGDDTIDGKGSGDTVSGGAGDDTLLASAGGDTLNGDAGSDLIDEGDVVGGSDTVSGGADEDTIDYSGRLNPVRIDLSNAGEFGSDDDGESGEGDDLGEDVEVLKGGAAGDTIIGSDWNPETMYGGDGDDTITGGSENGDCGCGDDIYGDGGNDTIDAGYGDDTVHGGMGNDTVNMGSGSDTFEAEAVVDGADTISNEDRLDDTISYRARTTAVSIRFDATANDGAAGEGDLIVTGDFSGFDIAYGGSGNDTIVGGIMAGFDLFGGAGNDTITGSSGWDTLAGGAGTADRLIGTKAGTMSLSSTLLKGPGVDAISGFELATLTGGGAKDTITVTTFPGKVTIWGLGGNDVLTGGAKVDTVHGGAGNDTVTGGKGADTVYGDAGADIFRMRDSTRDVIYGGTQVDTCTAANRDAVDRLSSIEVR